MNEILGIPTPQQVSTRRRILGTGLSSFPAVGSASSRDRLQTSASFDYTAIASGFTGATSLTKTAGRHYGRNSRTLWVGRIFGTRAVLTANSDFGTGDGLIVVSVDGGPYRDAPRDKASSRYVLFDGLDDSWHIVSFRYGAGFANAPYVLTTGNILTVTGSSPSVSPVQNWAQFDGGDSNSFFTCRSIANAVDYMPSNLPADANATSNVACGLVRGSFTEMFVIATSGNVYISKDGGYPRSYQLNSRGIAGLAYIPLDGSFSSYYVWCGEPGSGANRIFAIGTNQSRQALSMQKRLIQFGDSISNGFTSSAIQLTHGDVDTMHIAAHFGYVGSTTAVSGHTTANLQSNLSAWLAGYTVSSSDVAVVAIGRNDSVFDATWETNYTDIINQLLTKGFGKVLCRGVLPEGSNLFPVTNAAIQARVTAASNPNVVFIDTSTWSGIETHDAVHPTQAGYHQITEYAKTAYAAYM